jgi:hypothetical protein
VEALPEVNAVQATPAAVDYAALAAHQAVCQLTQRVASSTSLQIEKRMVVGVELICDVSRGGVRPLVPLVDRPAVFAAFHELAHAGTRATKRLIAARVMWRGLNSDVAAWVKNCQQCERAKASRLHTAAVQPIAIPARHFTHIHVDIGLTPAERELKSSSSPHLLPVDFRCRVMVSRSTQLMLPTSVSQTMNSFGCLQ